MLLKILEFCAIKRTDYELSINYFEKGGVMGKYTKVYMRNKK